MKKILHTFLVCLGIMMISSQTFAQDAAGEKLQPYVGNTYEYSFKGLDVGLDYTFYFSSSLVGVGVNNSTFTGYIDTPTSTVPTTGIATVKVVYPADAATGTPVYLFIKVYDTSDDAICENYKAVEINPIANAFTVDFADVTTNGNPSSCPDLNGLQAVVKPTSYTYNEGTSELTFTATRDGDLSVNEWSLQFDIDQTAGTVDYTYSISGGATVVSTVGTASKTVDLTKITTKTITITLTVQNYQGETPVFSISNISAVDNVNSASPASISGLTHTIKEMPVIGDFQ